LLKSLDLVVTAQRAKPEFDVRVFLTACRHRDVSCDTAPPNSTHVGLTQCTDVSDGFHELYRPVCDAQIAVPLEQDGSCSERRPGTTRRRRPDRVDFP
jgi:hypothetical protein